MGIAAHLLYEPICKWIMEKTGVSKSAAQKMEKTVQIRMLTHLGTINILRSFHNETDYSQSIEESAYGDDRFWAFTENGMSVYLKTTAFKKAINNRQI